MVHSFLVFPQLNYSGRVKPLLRCCCACWHRLFLKGLLQLVSPPLSVPGPWPSTPTPLASATKLLSVPSPHVWGPCALYLRPRLCLGVTVPVTDRAPWKRGCRPLFSCPERHGGRLDRKKKTEISLKSTHIRTIALSPADTVYCEEKYLCMQK